MMKRLSDSLAICLDDVPDATREWKPDSEPKARMRGMAGQRGVLLPLFETEVKGAKMLNRLTEHLFAA